MINKIQAMAIRSYSKLNGSDTLLLGFSMILLGLGLGVCALIAKL